MSKQTFAPVEESLSLSVPLHMCASAVKAHTVCSAHSGRGKILEHRGGVRVGWLRFPAIYPSISSF